MKLLAAMLLIASSASAWAVLPELKGVPDLTTAQSDYVEHCSGCHGMQGNSAPADIPVLRDRVGYFMCTQAGARLPDPPAQCRLFGNHR